MDSSPEQCRSVVEKMVSAMHHRGPDAQGIWQGESGKWCITLGHARLSILDLSDTARQPMVDVRSGCGLVYNGEIYNFQKIREELQREGAGPFDSSGDTQVLLRAYVHWGPAMVKKLRGMFAFAIYDPHRQCLFLGRDHFGIKPLYVVEVAGGWAFASEVRTLLQVPWIERRLDPQGLLSYLSYGSVQEPFSLVSGIRPVPPGTAMTVNLAGDRIEISSPEAYWDIMEMHPGNLNISMDEAARQVREALAESVRLHMVSDVPLGVFLSGGMDSSSIAALMMEAASSQVCSLNIAFDEAEFDESRIATAVAQRLGTQHREIRLTAADFLQHMPSWLKSIDQPSSDGANTWIISKACREAGMTVALSGLGADELFGGYSTFSRTATAAKLFRTIGWLPQTVRGWLAGIIRKAGNQSITSSKLAEWMVSRGSHVETYLILRQLLVPPKCEEILDPGFLQEAGYSNYRADTLEKLQVLASNGDAYAAVSLLETRTYLLNTLLRDSDQMSMSQSLEIRVPFIDVEIIQTLLKFPEAIRFGGKGPKPLLRAAMKDWLDPAWIERPKMTFTLPFDRWLRGPLKDEVEQGLMRLSGFPFKDESIQKLWCNFLEDNGQVNSSQIIMLYMLSHWVAQHGITAD